MRVLVFWVLVFFFFFNTFTNTTVLHITHHLNTLCLFFSTMLNYFCSPISHDSFANRTQFSFSSFFDSTHRNLPSFNFCPTFFLTFIALWSSFYKAGWEVQLTPSQNTSNFSLLRHYYNGPITGQTVSLDYSFLGAGTSSYNFLNPISYQMSWHLAKAQCLLNEYDKWQ